MDSAVVPNPEILPAERLGPGAHADGEGVHFVIDSAHAERIELCLFDPGSGAQAAALDLPHRDGDRWSGFVPGLAPGAHYGYRVHGPWAPEQGHRFNPAKLLIDPYARALGGRIAPHPAQRGDVGDDSAPCPVDSAPFAPRSVVTAPRVPAAHARPATAWADTLIYEAHVRGLTMQRDDVPAALRGRYEALASPAVIEHLLRLGVTAVELLPIHALLDERFLADRGLRNYWGYNTLAYFAPEPRYLGPGGADGLRAAIAALHEAGIEVLLDVVYNHTAEGDHRGPTLCFRGLDNARWYRLEAGRRDRYVNDTGCGNTLDFDQPVVQRLVLDSLRHWAEDYGVDGFRFDLATVLGRHAGGFDANHPFLQALASDPVLGGLKLVAEPWDVGPGGYRAGEFPAPFREWNDRFRDDARRFWRGDAGAGQGLAARLLGSADRFRGGRGPLAGVNFVTAHDGFTLADVTAYARRHNEANGEGNRDGHGHNYSDNGGVEGPTRHPGVLAGRQRRARNLLATLFFAQGVPMLLAGDESGNSQQGNNNAYCQDNAIGWVDWPPAEPERSRFVARLAELRRAHPVLRQARFLHGTPREGDGLPDLQWFGLAGGAPDWGDPGLDGFGLLLRDVEGPVHGADTVFMVFYRGLSGFEFPLPRVPGAARWDRLLDSSAPERPVTRHRPGEAVPIAPASVSLFSLQA